MCLRNQSPLFHLPPSRLGGLRLYFVGWRVIGRGHSLLFQITLCPGDPEHTLTMSRMHQPSWGWLCDHLGWALSPQTCPGPGTEMESPLPHCCCQPSQLWGSQHRHPVNTLAEFVNEAPPQNCYDGKTIGVGQYLTRENRLIWNLWIIPSRS